MREGTFLYKISRIVNIIRIWLADLILKVYQFYYHWEFKNTRVTMIIDAVFVVYFILWLILHGVVGENYQHLFEDAGIIVLMIYVISHLAVLSLAFIMLAQDEFMKLSLKYQRDTNKYWDGYISLFVRYSIIFLFATLFLVIELHDSLAKIDQIEDLWRQILGFIVFFVFLPIINIFPRKYIDSKLVQRENT